MSVDQSGKLPLKVIVPLTDWKARYDIAPWMVKMPAIKQKGLTKTSVADCFQVRSISDLRLVKRIGVILPEQLSEIGRSLGLVLKIDRK